MTDADVRALRERFELAVHRGDAAACLEAARDMVALCSGDSDYALLRLEPRPREESIRIVAQRAETCSRCNAPIRKDASVWWTPGTSRVTCARCPPA